MDAETSRSDRGKPKCNLCKGSFPVYECLCVQTCGELSNRNWMMEEDGVMKTGVMKACDDDE